MLGEMMRDFKKNNFEHGITGLLIYSEGSFLQLIEGDEKPIDRLMKLIQKDKIHHSLIILAQAKTELRIFPAWSMGYEAVSQEQFAGVRQLLQQSSNALGFADQSHPVLNYIKSFAADPLKIYK